MLCPKSTMIQSDSPKISTLLFNSLNLTYKINCNTIMWIGTITNQKPLDEDLDAMIRIFELIGQY